MQALVANVTSTAMGRALIFGVIAALLTSGGITIATTVTSGDLGTASVKLAGQAFSDDSDVVVTAKGIITREEAGHAYITVWMEKDDGTVVIVGSASASV